MARLAIDEAAWSNAWRHRSTGEKALLSLGLVVVAVTATSPVVPAVVLVVAGGAVLIGARVSPGVYARALAAPVVFVLVGALSVALVWGAPSTGIRWAAGPFAMTEASVGTAVLVASRALAASAAMLLLAVTTPMTDLLAALRRARVPDVVVDIAGLIYRMLFSLLDALVAVREAQAARLGYVNGSAARRSVAGMGAAVVMRAWHQARRLEDGLAGRGSSGSLRVLSVSRPASPAFVVASLAVIGSLGAWSWMVAA